MKTQLLTLLAASSVMAQMSSEVRFEYDFRKPESTVIKTNLTNRQWNQIAGTNTFKRFNTEPFIAVQYPTLNPQTNWTGIQFQGRELGYIVTNHVTHIEYKGVTNDFTLLTESGSVAVWRTNTHAQWWTNVPITITEMPKQGFYYFTNAL